MSLSEVERFRLQELVVRAKSFALDGRAETELRQLTAKEYRAEYPLYAPREYLVDMAVHLLRVWAKRERGVIFDRPTS